MTRENIRPLITVYIVNYNYGKYLSRSISSVLSQTYKNYELIIIDDGSSDKSKKIINSFKNLKIIKKIFNKNIGLNRSNNVGLKYANGEYIIRLDADDYFHKNALKTFVNHIKKNPDSVLIYPDYFLINENGDKLARVKRENFLKKVKMLDLPAHGACTMFKVSTLKKVGGYDEDFNCQDGYDIWLKIIYNFKISNINKPLFYYRQHSSNLTRNEKKILFTRAKIKEKRVSVLKLDKKDTLAVIPIRKSNFNLKFNPFTKVKNKKLIDIAISFTLKSKYIAKSIVSTDSEEVYDYVKKRKNVGVEKRKDYDGSSLSKVVLNLFEKPKYKKFKNIIILFIEFPFRSEIYIDKAINSLRLFKADVIECVRPEKRLIYFHDGKGLKLLKPDNFLKSERDNIYVRTGGIIAFSKNQFLKKKKIYHKSSSMGHIIIDEKSSVDINTYLNFKTFEVD